MSNASSPLPPQVRCPTCGAMSAYLVTQPYRPFCSQRCQSIDWGAWAGERFRVAAASEPDAPPPASDDESDDAGLI